MIVKTQNIEQRQKTVNLIKINALLQAMKDEFC